MNIISIDDSKSVLSAIQFALSELGDVQIRSFLDPEKALAACAAIEFDLVLVDYTMPKLSGIDVIKTLRASEAYQLVPIIMITSETERSIRINALEAGATEFLKKPFDAIELKARVQNLLKLRQAQLDLADRASWLARAVARKTKELAAREEEIIWRLARAIEYRDGQTGEHISRVAMICKLIAEGLGLSPQQCQTIYLAAPLHDIGKIGISDSILSKSGPLTPAEFEQMRLHVDIGARILEDGTSELVRVAASIAAGHHEKWDGTGYPKHLSGTQIPLEARIAAVADVFDALCSERPYKKAWPVEKAFAEIRAGSGAHFDPDCVDAFTRQWPKIAALCA